MSANSRAIRNGWVALLLLAAACKRDPAEVEAERTAADKAALTEAVMLDVALDTTLRKADGQAAAGEEEQAATTLTDEAMPAANRAFDAASALHPSSLWGIARAKELTDVVRARRDALPVYVAALRGEDLDAKLAATQTQVHLEEQAMAVLAHVNGEAMPNATDASDAATVQP